MNKFFKLLISAGFPALVLGGTFTGKIVIDGVEYGDRIVRGNHQRAEQRRVLPCFERITVKTAIDVVYRPGPRCGARLSGDANLLDLIETTVQDNRLVIEVRRSMQSEGPLMIELSSPNLREIDLRSAADVRLERLRAPSLVIRANGSGDLRAEGRADRLEVLAGGSGTLDLSRLAGGEVRVRASGAADVMVNARDSLDIDLSGAGDVLYYGRPARISTRITGAGDVAAMD